MRVTSLVLTSLAVCTLIFGCRTPDATGGKVADVGDQASGASADAPEDATNGNDGIEPLDQWNTFEADAGTTEGAGEVLSPTEFAEIMPLVNAYMPVYELKQARGTTYLEFMRNTIRPAINKLATNGYKVKNGDAMMKGYAGSDYKIRQRVDNSWGGRNKVKSIANSLAGQTVNLNSLPSKLQQLGANDAFGLATFIGLASGGGVNIKYADKNYGLNVHYDVEDERSGRSFGIGPTRRANDASDKQYLDDLQEYSRGSPDNLRDFYKTMFHALLDSDPSNYPKVTPDGQSVLTDFLAVFTAEQARNLMDGNVSPHWDAALMEVTLLAAFHSGQDKLKLYYFNPKDGTVQFTSRTLKQKPCAIPTTAQSAGMRDYWQFSRNIDSTQHCKRSGINITKNEFRKLGKALTSYIYRNHREAFNAVYESMGLTGFADNLFKSLSYFLISENTPSEFDRSQVEQITNAWVDMLMILQAEANEISQELDE